MNVKWCVSKVPQYSCRYLHTESIFNLHHAAMVRVTVQLQMADTMGLKTFLWSKLENKQWQGQRFSKKYKSILMHVYF